LVRSHRSFKTRPNLTLPLRVGQTPTFPTAFALNDCSLAGFASFHGLNTGTPDGGGFGFLLKLLFTAESLGNGFIFDSPMTAFLRKVGYGDLGEIHLYSGPIPATSVYSLNGDRLQSVLLNVAGGAIKAGKLPKMIAALEKLPGVDPAKLGQLAKAAGEKALPLIDGLVKRDVDDVVAPRSGLSRLFGRNEYKVVDDVLAGKVKNGLLDFYNKNGGRGIRYVDDALLTGRNGALNTKTGEILISKGLRDKYPHLLEGTILEELQHFHQLKARGWFGRSLTQAEHDLLESEVVRRLLRSGLEIFE